MLRMKETKCLVLVRKWKGKRKGTHINNTEPISRNVHIPYSGIHLAEGYILFFSLVAALLSWNEAFNDGMDWNHSRMLSHVVCYMLSNQVTRINSNNSESHLIGRLIFRYNSLVPWFCSEWRTYKRTK